MKQLTKQLTTGYLDHLRRTAVKIRDKHKCVFCSCTRKGEDHHVEKRRHRLTRWEMDDGLTCCPCCHQEKSDVEMHTKLKEIIGDARYQRIVALAKGVLKQYCVENGITVAEYKQKKADELREYIKCHKGEGSSSFA